MTRLWLGVGLLIFALAACGGEEGITPTPVVSPSPEVEDSRGSADDREISTFLGIDFDSQPDSLALMQELIEASEAVSILPPPELEEDAPLVNPVLAPPGWRLTLELPSGEVILGMEEGCPEPPLERFSPGCNTPVPPPFPGSARFPQAYLYCPDNATFPLRHLYLSLLPPAQVRVWQVVVNYPGNLPTTISWELQWDGEETDEELALRLVDAKGFIDIRRPGSLEFPGGEGRQTATILVCAETLGSSGVCPDRWP